MKKLSKRLCNLVLLIGTFSFISACGGGSSGGDDSAGGSSDTAMSIEGTLRSSAANSRMLGAGDGGLGGIEVGALGDTSITDDFGNFSLTSDGMLFPGGAVQFSFRGSGIDQQVTMDDVAGGPGALALVDFVLEESGDISGESRDADGNLLSENIAGRLGCSVTQSFSDGGGGALWKPLSERTGTVVILMPSQYREASVEVYNSSNQVVDGPLIRDCCSHNGGREHIYLTRSAGDLASTGAPLTVRFEFADGFVDCREVPNPTQRYD